MNITKEQADKVIDLAEKLKFWFSKDTMIGKALGADADSITAIMRGLADAEPTVKQSLTVHKSAEDYLRYRHGSYRGHFAWRELEEAYSQGRYDEEMLQGPSPWPDDASEVHYKRGYAVALSDAEEAIDDECRERVVTASDCIEIIRNLSEDAATSPQAAQTEAALCEMVRLSEDAGLYDSDFQAGRAGSKP